MAAFSTRRRAEEFARLVEQPGAHDPSYADLLEVAGSLRSLDPISPRSDFSADLRERLMTEAVTVLHEHPRTVAIPARSRNRNRRLAAAVGAVAIAGASTSVAMAAQSALPGDPLYPIKETVEGARSATSSNESAAMLDRAARRLDEAMALSTRREPGDEERIPDTLADFTDQARQGSALAEQQYAESGDRASLTRLQEFSATSMSMLASLEDQVPSAAQDEFEQAASLVESISRQASSSCADCGAAVRNVLALPDVVAGPVLTPQAPDDGPPAGDGGDGRAGEVKLPEVRPGDLPPGSVNPGDTIGPPRTTALDPVRDLTEGVVDDRTEARLPRLPVRLPTKPVRDLGGLLDSTVDDLTGGALDPVTDGLKDTTDGLSDGLDGLSQR